MNSPKNSNNVIKLNALLVKYNSTILELEVQNIAPVTMLLDLYLNRVYIYRLLSKPYTFIRNEFKELKTYPSCSKASFFYIAWANFELEHRIISIEKSLSCIRND